MLRNYILVGLRQEKYGVLKRRRSFIARLNNTEDEASYINRVYKIDGGICSFRRFFDCDLTLAVKPFRDLADGDIKPLFDNLLPMMLHLSYYGKYKIAGKMIMFLDNIIHLHQNKPMIFEHLCETSRVSCSDLIQELQNAYLGSICNSAAYRSDEYFKHRSVLIPLISELKSIMPNVYKAKKTVGVKEKEGKRKSYWSRIFSTKLASDIKPLLRKKNVETLAKGWILNSYDCILSKKEEYSNLISVD